MSMRSAAVAALTGAMPATWTVIDDERSLNNIRQPTMIVSVRTIEPADFAPLSHLIVTMAVIVLSPHTDATTPADTATSKSAIITASATSWAACTG